jgi:hypothetical protein
MSHEVKKGQVTYDAEGSDVASSKYYSREIHWPGNSLSGVTIGRGYDMGNRTKVAVKHDMLKAGIEDKKATSLSEGAGLKGDKAKEFVTNNKESITKITVANKVKMFDKIYPGYEIRAKNNYIRWTASEKDKTEWDKLHQAIKDVLVDFVYQGFTKGAKPMKAGMKNDFDELIKYINGSTTMKRYEAGRNRVKYLKKHKPTTAKAK